MAILFVVCALPQLMGSSCDPPVDPPGDGFLDLALELGPTDGTVLEDMSFFTVGVSRIELIHRTVLDDPDTETRITLELDLPPLVVSSEKQGVPFLFARAVVPAGFLMQIRLVTEEDTAFLAVNGQSVPFKVPSGPQTGFKVKPVDGDSFPIVEAELTAVVALLDPATHAKFNNGVGFRMGPSLAGRVVDPESLETIDIVTPGQDIAETTPEQKEELEQAERQSIIDAFVSKRIALIDRDEVELIVRGTITDLIPTPVVTRHGRCVIDTLAVMDVDQSFILPAGPEIEFFAAGGVLDTDPGAGCPLASSDHNNPRLLVGDPIQAVLFPTIRDSEEVLLVYAGQTGVTPLELPPGTPQVLRDAVDDILAHTEAEHEGF